jgi:hypothetical protein
MNNAHPAHFVRDGHCSIEVTLTEKTLAISYQRIKWMWPLYSVGIAFSSSMTIT